MSDDITELADRVRKYEVCSDCNQRAVQISPPTNGESFCWNCSKITLFKLGSGQTETYYVQELANRVRWIPCEESLPEDNLPVLLSDGKWVNEGFREAGTFYCASDPEGFGEVIAWMPMPQPYKPE